MDSFAITSDDNAVDTYGSLFSVPRDQSFLSSHSISLSRSAHQYGSPFLTTQSLNCDMVGMPMDSIASTSGFQSTLHELVSSLDWPPSAQNHHDSLQSCVLSLLSFEHPHRTANASSSTPVRVLGQEPYPPAGEENAAAKDATIGSGTLLRGYGGDEILEQLVPVSQTRTTQFEVETGAKAHQKTAKRALQCPLPDCLGTFPTYDGWKRHQDMHYKRWTCMLTGSHVINGHCVFCGERNVTKAHGRSHPGLEQCLEERPVFRGRDKLCDHIKVHLDGQALSAKQIAKRKKLLTEWARQFAPSEEALWCGFCADFCPTWEHRQVHILKHVKEGLTNLEWMTKP